MKIIEEPDKTNYLIFTGAISNGMAKEYLPLLYKVKSLADWRNSILGPKIKKAVNFGRWALFHKKNLWYSLDEIRVITDEVVRCTTEDKRYCNDVQVIYGLTRFGIKLEEFINPSIDKEYYLLAVNLYSSKEFDEGMLYIEKALEIKPNDMVYYHLYMDYCLMAKKILPFDRFISFWGANSIIQLFPDFTYQWIKLLCSFKEYKQAFDVYTLMLNMAERDIENLSPNELTYRKHVIEIFKKKTAFYYKRFAKDSILNNENYSTLNINNPKS